MSNLIDKQDMINSIDEYKKELCEIFGDENELVRIIEAVKGRLIKCELSDEQIQKMQDLHQAEIEKAFELGREDAKPKWIPASDRLPEDGTWNIFSDGKNISVERYKMDAIDHFFPQGRWFSFDKAIAWMPLPEPYQEEGENNE